MRFSSISNQRGSVEVRSQTSEVGNLQTTNSKLPTASESQSITNDQSSTTPEIVVVGNIDASTDWSEALKGMEAVVHLAARVHIMDDTAEDPLAAFREVNVDGTRRLAEEAAKAGVKRFVFISSIKVNGEETGGMRSAVEGRKSDVRGQWSEVGRGRKSGRGAEVRGRRSEDRAKNQELRTKNLTAAFSKRDTPNPEDPYGQSKWEAEVELRKIEASTGMQVVILRPPLLYGPGVKANFLKLIQLVDKGIPLPLGSIRNKRSLLSLTNFADLISRCVTDERAAGETFTVCDGDDLSTAELVKRIAKALGKKPHLLPVPEGVIKLAGKLTGKSAQVQRLCSSLQIDSSHVRKTLDWEPPCTMEQELERVSQWFKSPKS